MYRTLNYPDVNKIFFVGMAYSLYHRATKPTFSQESQMVQLSFSFYIRKHRFDIGFFYMQQQPLLEKQCFHHKMLAQN